LFLTFNLILTLEIENCIVSQKTTTTEPTKNHIGLIWFSF